jgi:hypothetical protein
MSHQHITDLAAYALASAGMATAIMPPDYGALGVAAIGGIIGGFLSVAVVPEAPTETRRSIGLKWAVSSLTSITITPFLFQRLSHPEVNAAGILVQFLPNTAEAMLAMSTMVAFVAWLTLRIGQAAWAWFLRGYLRGHGALPPEPRRRRTDRGEGGRINLTIMVLLAGLALLVWIVWDVLVLLWLLFTTTVH